MTRSAGAFKEQASKRFVFLRHVCVVEREPERRAALVAEAFDVGQLARASSATGAVARTDFPLSRNAWKLLP